MALRVALKNLTGAIPVALASFCDQIAAVDGDPRVPEQGAKAALLVGSIPAYLVA